MRAKKAISVLGSTGSVGRQTLEIIHEFSDRFELIGLSANRNIDLLKDQIPLYQLEKYRQKPLV